MHSTHAHRLPRCSNDCAKRQRRQPVRGVRARCRQRWQRRRGARTHRRWRHQLVRGAFVERIVGRRSRLHSDQSQRNVSYALRRIPRHRRSTGAHVDSFFSIYIMTEFYVICTYIYSNFSDNTAARSRRGWRRRAQLDVRALYMAPAWRRDGGSVGVACRSTTALHTALHFCQRR